MSLNEKDLMYISSTCAAQLFQAASVIELLMEGNTVPFISRYRKERTGNLDELKVQQVKEAYDYVSELNERKDTVLKTIEGQGKLTDELRKKIGETYSKTELEDIYLPYKPKRRTKATIAREKGLEPLAAVILDAETTETLENLAKPFISEELAVLSVEEALEGAGHIIAEMYSENASLRKGIRDEVADKGVITVSVTKEFENERTKFEQYYNYNEPVKNMPSHRILAVRRGEAEKVLKTNIAVDKDLIRFNYRSMLFDASHPRYNFLDEILADALERLLLPSIEQDIQSELKKRADEEAIRVFAQNAENLLLSSPAGNLRVLGVDPGFRTGCKLVVLDETGKLLEAVAIFPTKPREDIEGSTRVVKQLIEKHGVQAVAIGNGTASRETLQFFKSITPEGVIVSMVSEAGASVYSASAAGREDFPDQDVTVRGAVSIGRRFQDPLAELVKIDPKSIGVGQYQHDVNQSLLKTKLDHVVTSVVNRVGVELNTASYHLLKYVSGIGPTLAKNIVQYRNDNGMFRNREDLNHVRMFGARAFQQSAGFFRIRKAENPLDATGIHPESYSVVSSMCERLGLAVDRLIRNRDILNQIRAEEFVTDKFGVPTIKDIVRELEAPGRDPREDFQAFEFEEGVETIGDLTEGMVLRGIVTNVTKFGAFVDIGVHQDGLVHISELSHEYITTPEDVIHVEDKVKVKVISIDPKLNRIQLSIKALVEPPTKNIPKKGDHGQGVRDKNAAVKGSVAKKDWRNRDERGNKGPNPQKPQADKTKSAVDSLKAAWGAK